MIVRLDGEEVQLLPWNAATPKPWRNGYERVVRRLKHKTKRGAIAEILIVRNSRLKTTKH